jgi:hypothetical protein
MFCHVKEKFQPTKGRMIPKNIAVEAETRKVNSLALHCNFADINLSPKDDAVKNSTVSKEKIKFVTSLKQ